MVSPELVRISKSFGSHNALEDVSLALSEGEIHGLIGENGAGKSTLMRILVGFYHADQGEIRIRGEKVESMTPSLAIELGIGMLHQHFMLVNPLTVLDNIILGREPKRRIWIDRKKAAEEIQLLIKQVRIDLDLQARIQDLSVSQQQQVEIVKLLYRKADILILDEPTAVLTPQETDTLFEVLRELRKQGKTILMITHKMAEILALTDRVTVLRGGKNVGERETGKTSRDELARLMVGRDVELRVHKNPPQLGDVVLHLENVTAKGDRGERALDSLTFDVRGGEIVGVAGVMGNGQTELEEVLTGLRPSESGKMELFGRDLTGLSVREIRRLGIKHLPEPAQVGHVPEDRQKMGLILSWTVEDNLLLGQHDIPQFHVGPFLQRGRISQQASQLVVEFDVRPPDPNMQVKMLSGGNQQKVVLAREFYATPKFVVISQPTRGVDIGAIEFIHKKILELRSKGAAILLISAELEEIFALSDRILVLYKGRNMGDVKPEAVNERKIGLMMMGSAT